eukprot:scaffold16371_cov60-Phaeocystis_antarctica.AAC.6
MPPFIGESVSSPLEKESSWPGEKGASPAGAFSWASSFHTASRGNSSFRLIDSSPSTSTCANMNLRSSSSGSTSGQMHFINGRSSDRSCGHRRRRG